MKLDKRIPPISISNIAHLRFTDARPFGGINNLLLSEHKHVKNLQLVAQEKQGGSVTGEEKAEYSRPEEKTSPRNTHVMTVAACIQFLATFPRQINLARVTPPIKAKRKEYVK